jgi:hypothetical protein
MEQKHSVYGLVSGFARPIQTLGCVEYSDGTLGCTEEATVCSVDRMARVPRSCFVVYYSVNMSLACNIAAATRNAGCKRQARARRYSAHAPWRMGNRFEGWGGYSFLLHEFYN